MIPRDVYLMKAAHLFAKAAAERDSAVKADFELIARAYLRLADQAKRNAQNDIVYETPPPRRNHSQQVHEWICVVLKAANSDAIYCYKKALAARERALKTKYPEDRVFYFEADARWLKLAKSHEFSARAEQFIASQPTSPQTSMRRLQD